MIVAQFVVVENNFFEVNGFLKLDNKELAELQQCLIRERWQCCRFCKKCVECKRFTFFNEEIKNANMNRDRNIYTTRYKVISNIQNGVHIQWTY